MDISRLDKNFCEQEAKIEDGEITLKLPCEQISLFGTTYDFERGWFQRMPYEKAKSVSYLVEVLSSTTAGARARFSTDSKKFSLTVKYKYLAESSNQSRLGASGFSVFEETEDGYKYVGVCSPKAGDREGFARTLKLKGEMSDYIVFFPTYNDYVTEVSFTFDKGSTVRPGRKYKFNLPILYYGSSITQGACCTKPDNAYQAYISKWHNVDYLNLGFSGGAKGEDAMIEYLSSVKSKVFVCDYDYNASTPEHLQKTHYRLYKAYRDSNPDTPIIFMSSPNFEKDPVDRRKRENIIKKTIKLAKEQGDFNVYFVRGKDMFGKEDRENCTTDSTHPTDLGFYRMAKALNKVIAPLLK